MSKYMRTKDFLHDTVYNLKISNYGKLSRLVYKIEDIKPQQYGNDDQQWTIPLLSEQVTQVTHVNEYECHTEFVCDEVVGATNDFYDCVRLSAPDLDAAIIVMKKHIERKYSHRHCLRHSLRRYGPHGELLESETIIPKNFSD